MLTKKLILSVHNGNDVRVEKILTDPGAPDACVTQLEPIKILNVDPAGSALHFAAYRGYTKMVEMFLDYGVNIDIKTTTDAATPFLRACRKAHMSTMRLLIKRGADVNVADKHDRTPLHFACASGNVEAMFMLIDLDADLDAMDKRGYYPTQLASLPHQQRIAEFLNFREVQGLRHRIGEEPSRANSMYGGDSIYSESPRKGDIFDDGASTSRDIGLRLDIWLCTINYVYAYLMLII